MRKMACILLLLMITTGCGIQTSSPTTGGEAPTGVAPGQIVYFIDETGRVTPEFRDTGRLGTIGEAVSLLLSGPGGSKLTTDIRSGNETRAIVSVDQDIEIRLPLSADELGEHGLDQIVCTALAAHIQSGGSPTDKVRIVLTQPSAESQGSHTCPLL